MKPHVNSFEVETLIAPHDVRCYRFDFSCVTKRALLSCERLYKKAVSRGIELDRVDGTSFADELGVLASQSPEVQRTVPSFYNLHISFFTADNPVYSPYLDEYFKKFGHAPFEAREKNPACFMPLDSIKKIAAEAAELSGEAVVSLSAWGEALSHPHIVETIQTLLSHSGLSVLIETDGSLVTEKLCADIKSVIDSAPRRTNSYEKLYWIVYIDAVDETMYTRLHPRGDCGESPSLLKAIRALEILEKSFGKAVYPQFLRTTLNEDQLEAFYRAYKEKGNLIIQKYDPFCGKLPDLRPADLAPVDRHPCWHLTRDMVILADGGVPLCREYVLAAPANFPNVFTTGVSAAWEKSGIESDLCKECDEYYTFNF
jgi:spiro-SPASM protein